LQEKTRNVLTADISVCILFYLERNNPQKEITTSTADRFLFFAIKVDWYE
jgi:hypothetical protein